MKKASFIFIIFISVFVSAGFAAAETDARFNAGWKILRGDVNSGIISSDTYYFYPDGLFARQGYQRREFVTIGRWKIDGQKHLVIYDQQPRNTTLSAEELDNIKKQEMRFAVVFDSNTSMRWTRDAKGASTITLSRVRDLPDRTENVYWGLGTDESHERGMGRELGLKPKKKEAGQ